MDILAVSFLALVVIGIIFIIIGHRFRVAEHKAFFAGGILKASGFTPLSMISIWKYKDYWQPPGFALHSIGLCLICIGLAINLIRILI